MGSTRLPGKVLRVLGDQPVLGWVVRAASAAAMDRVIVATSTEPEDNPIVAFCRAQDVDVSRGDRDDVLSRFLRATEDFDDGEAVVRLTADCPLLDPQLIAATIASFEACKVDYLSTVTPRSLPRGLDVEVVRMAALRAAGAKATGADRVHVTSYIYAHPEEFRIAGLTFQPSAADLRVTLDTDADAQMLDALIEIMGTGPHSWRDVVAVLRRHPEIVAINADVRQKTVGEG